MIANETRVSRERQVAALQALHELALNLSVELEMERLLPQILAAAVRVMEATAGSLLLYDSTRDELVFEVVEGGGGESLKGSRIKSDQGLAGQVFTRRMPLMSQDAQRDPRFLHGFDQSYGFHTTNLLAVPLTTKRETIGVLEVLNKSNGEPFTVQDQEILMIFAAQSAITIENARLYQQVVRERDRILTVEASVRHELARALHDGPTQMISALVMNVRFLRDLVQHQPQMVADELVQMEAIAQKALYQVRNLLFDLRPLVLEAQGMAAALLTYAERLRLLEPFSIDVDTDGLTARWPANVEAAIFSIIQEAVNNAKKHAAPHRLWIRAVQDAQQVTLSVRDDGRGFDVAATERALAGRDSLGLLNMRERAQVANAQLYIDSSPGHGATITLVVPLPRG